MAMAPSAASGDEVLAEKMSGLVVSDHDVPKAIDDIQTQGISGARCEPLGSEPSRCLLRTLRTYRRISLRCQARRLLSDQRGEQHLRHA